MTREEAVNRFKGIRKSFSISIAQSKFYPSKAELNELCDMAIESLTHDIRTETHGVCSDLISRADAIEAVCEWGTNEERKGNLTATMVSVKQCVADILSALPSAETHEIRTETHGVCSDLISRADALQCKPEFLNPNPNDKPNNYPIGWNDAIKVWYADIKSLPSADAEPKWNCTANFVAEQLDRLRKMTDEEKWEFFRKIFGMGDAVQGEWIDVKNEPYCECSVCGSYIDNLDDDYAFCPRCGVRMKGGAE